MLDFKTNVRIFIIEFICAVILEGVYAVSINGIEVLGLVAIGLLPALLMFLFAYNLKNEDIIIRCLHLSALISFIYLAIIVHTQISLPFMLLVVAVTLGLFIKPKRLLEYMILSMIVLIVIGAIMVKMSSEESNFQLYTTYVMMYAFSCVALLFIVVGVEKYRKKMEEKNEIAREALEAKSNFLANMSHEIRTPMNAIYGMAELLAEGDFKPKEKEYISTIKRSSENLLSIINEILDFSKVDSGKMNLDHEPYDFNSLVQDVVSIIEFRLRDKNIKLVTNIDDNVPKELIGDENKIRQILINLLNNACKFTNRGTITLQINWEFESDNKGTFHIDVIDTGIGISQENITKLFTAFGQLNTKKNRNVEGTGLGLAICKKFLNLMGGSISVKSKLKEGSTFTVTIPQSVYDASPSKYKENCGEVLNNLDTFRIDFSAPSANVLIVDDNKVNRQVAGELCKLFGIEADMAESGQDAIDKVERHLKNYDLIFMDHMMPFMDGVEATKIIRNLEGDYPKKLPIIALTANAVNGAHKQFLNSGMNDYLAKPIKIQQLNDMLRKWIPAKKLFAPGTTLADIAKEEPDYSLMTKEEILESLEGIDIITGIKNCAGSKDVYYDLLQTYATSNLATTLTRYFEAEDLANYAVTAHSIKGASKNIGAHDIADKAYSLERAGERGDIHYIWDNHDELIEEYTALLKKLRKIFFNT
ncbi:MAG TPA: hypothetical protein DCP07_08620 [Lachnospiraceae bacterium]|nr:hypothetical protein [Lachnospiraceae bacterium]